MFTGIIRHLGTVRRLRTTSGGARLSIEAGDLLGSLAGGDSVCVSGVCLTVVTCGGGCVEFDVIAETLRRSTLGSLSAGGRVNLELSLRVGDKVDGHFVQGHVDGVARLERRDTRRGEHVLWFSAPADVRPCLIPKGSVAVDGVSLTIAEVTERSFAVAIVPTTLELTSLASLRVGDAVNIETDILARTVVRHIDTLRGPGGLTLEKLASQGFA